MSASRRFALFSFALMAVILAGVLLWLRRSAPTDEPNPAELEAQAHQQAEQSAREWEAYRPLSRTRLDDLDADAVALLRGLPGVATVTRSGPQGKPLARIVHLCDLHIVPPEALGVERGSAAYRRHLAQVEMVHHQHLAVLRCLVRHHGLQAVHAEGLNDDGQQAWRERVALLKGMLADEPTLLAARKLGKLEADAAGLLEQVRSERLEAGAVGVLEALGEGRALPLESRQGGEIGQRDRAIVKRLLAAGPLAVVVLGGGHDLASEVARQGRNAEYLRVEVTRYPPP